MPNQSKQHRNVNPGAENSPPPPTGQSKFWDTVKKKAIDNIAATIVAVGALAITSGAVATWAALKSWVIVPGIPPGAVVAFNRSDSEGACPSGWSLFQPAGGRVIVGAGSHSNKDASGSSIPKHVSYKSSNVDGVGGSNEHTHTVHIQMPRGPANGSDYHWSDTPWSGAVPAIAIRPGGTPVFADATTDVASNEPPYIALYYCEKNSE